MKTTQVHIKSLKMFLIFFNQFEQFHELHLSES